jgi:hypothetical protein
MDQDFSSSCIVTSLNLVSLPSQGAITIALLWPGRRPVSDQGCANYGELPFYVVREQGIERKAGAPLCTPALLL